MKYPITPEYLDGRPEAIAELFRGFEDFVIQDLCEQLYYSGDMDGADIRMIRRFLRRGYSYKRIKRYMRRMLNASEKELAQIIEETLKKSQRYYRQLFARDVLAKAGSPDALIQQKYFARTVDELENFTKSAGMMIRGADGLLTWTPLAEVYHKTLDTAVYKVMAGGKSYGQAIKEATDHLARSGVQWVDYETGWHNRADVAARRAIITCISQTADAYNDEIVKAAPTTLWEISAHSGARDKPGKNPWANHKAWQGKIYSEDTNGKYPNLYAITGYGEVDGLMGANCRHMKTPFWEGISEREYTDEELQNIDPPPIEFEGRTYTAYEATQKQRQIETAVRELRRRIIAARAIQNSERRAVLQVQHDALMKKYADFSAAAKLPLQQDRMHVDQY